MCGRFSLTISGEEIAKYFQVSQVQDWSPRYNIAPSQEILTIVETSKSQRQLKAMKWGLIPSWAKNDKTGSKLINARGETVAEKPSFRNAFKHRRCLIIADGFYEWQNVGKNKQPYYIHLKNRQPFAFAGLWEVSNSEQTEEVLSCCIITTEANELMKPLHHRMPVILSRDVYSQWLDHNVFDREILESFLTPYGSDAMLAYQVTQKVNRPTNDHPDCVEPIVN
ncbi:SOS response-associated peptidase [Crocosphaera chwakensis]|uniref:Abasic site processing protein n=1 Tax=Crocosphaera chwakensis CCY0110 TaxID=391612 RepID=A3IYK1_9CHRO|nr:SOS response-associated peptidase [Crocosphaera chwakensis]EAZ88450.1 hypothetical protein CY0110_31185 [Crocosphaera chwakensis CCY0110]